MLKKLLCILLCLSTVFSLFGCGDKSGLDNIPTYEINAEYSEETFTLKATEKITYINTTGADLKFLKFNLFPNAYREGAVIKPVNAQSFLQAFPEGASYGNITVNKAASGNKRLEYEICGKDKNILKVNLSETLAKNKKTALEIDFTLKLANIRHRLGYNENTVNFGNFYPILCVYEGEKGFYECEYYSNGDPFYSCAANYYVNIKLQKDFVLAASGEIKNTETSGNYKTYHTEIKGARDYAFIISKNFSVISKKVLGINLHYYYYNDDDKDEAVKAAELSFKTFSNIIGDYPYNTLSVVQTGFVFGGMEYPALTYISDKLEGENYIEVIVHENAHQWWYSAVGNNQLECAYIDEGLAEYCTMLFYEKNPQYNKTRQNLVEANENTYRFYYDIYKQIYGKADTTMNRKLSDYTSEFEYINITYIKGMLLFENLREVMGDTKFFKFLRNFYKNNIYQIVDTGVLINECCKIMNVKGIIDSYVNGTAII